MELLFRRVQKIEKNLIGKNILDIGCNDGSLLNFFKKAKCNTFGVEPTDAGKIAKKIILYLMISLIKSLQKKFIIELKK